MRYSWPANGYERAGGCNVFMAVVYNPVAFGRAFDHSEQDR